MLVSIINEDENNAKRIEYIFELLLTILGISWKFINRIDILSHNHQMSDIIVFYGNSFKNDLKIQNKFKNKFKIFIPYSYTFKFETIKFIKQDKYDIPVFSPIPFDKVTEKVLYRYDDNIPAICFTSENLCIDFSFDLISAVHYLISRVEENNCKKRDKFGRFLGCQSNLYKNNLINFPIVDAYAKLLYDIFIFYCNESRTPLIFKSYWPNGKDFGICITHDIDVVRKWTIGEIIREIVKFIKQKNCSFKHFHNLLSTLNFNKDPYNNIETIIKLEKELKINSTFFVLAGTKNIKIGNQKVVGKYPKKFDLSSSIKHILNNGHEAGLHTSFYALKNENILLHEMTKFKNVVGLENFGIRQHFLNFSFPESFFLMNNFDIQFDSSLGFSDIAGYRTGISFPHKLFFNSHDMKSNFYEIPLIIMDCSFYNSEKKFEQNWNMLNDFLNKTLHFNGLCTINWHNSSISDHDNNLKNLFLKLFLWSKKRNGWFCNCNKLMKWWTNRNKFKINKLHQSVDKIQYMFEIPQGVEECFFEIYESDNYSYTLDKDRMQLISENNRLYTKKIKLKSKPELDEIINFTFLRRKRN